MKAIANKTATKRFLLPQVIDKLISAYKNMIIILSSGQEVPREWNRSRRIDICEIENEVLEQEFNMSGYNEIICGKVNCSYDCPIQIACRKLLRLRIDSCIRRDVAARRLQEIINELEQNSLACLWEETMWRIK